MREKIAILALAGFVHWRCLSHTLVVQLPLPVRQSQVSLYEGSRVRLRGDVSIRCIIHWMGRPFCFCCIPNNPIPTGWDNKRFQKMISSSNRLYASYFERKGVILRVILKERDLMCLVLLELVKLLLAIVCYIVEFHKAYITLRKQQCSL